VTLGGDCVVRFALTALVVWRITHLFAKEDGPAGVVFHLRRSLGQSIFGSLMDCFNCLSLWVAAPAALFVTRDPVLWAMSWAALSGAACLLDRVGGQPPDEPHDTHMQGE